MSTVLRNWRQEPSAFRRPGRAGPRDEDLDTEVALVQALIQLGLEAVHNALRRRARSWRRGALRS
jgi:hypothetical protein